MTTSAQRDAQEALLRFAVEGEPTPRRLEAFIGEHPDLRHELTDLAVEMVLEPARFPEPADAATARVVASAVARFQARMTSDPASRETPATNVFGAFVGPAFPQLAGRLGVSPAFLIKVRDGLVAAAGFPEALVQAIAREVGQAPEVVRALLQRPASMPVGTMAKASGKPSVGAKQSFEEAVATSGLDEAQRSRLLSMAKDARGAD